MLIFHRYLSASIEFITKKKSGQKPILSSVLRASIILEHTVSAMLVKGWRRCRETHIIVLGSSESTDEALVVEDILAFRTFRTQCAEGVDDETGNDVEEEYSDPHEEGHIVQYTLQEGSPILIADGVDDFRHAAARHSNVQNEPEARHDTVTAMLVVRLCFIICIVSVVISIVEYG